MGRQGYGSKCVFISSWVVPPSVRFFCGQVLPSLAGEDARYDVLFLRRPILLLPACLSPEPRVAGVPSLRSFRRGAAQLSPRCLRGIPTVPSPPCAASLGSQSGSHSPEFERPCSAPRVCACHLVAAPLAETRFLSAVSLHAPGPSFRVSPWRLRWP